MLVSKISTFSGKTNTLDLNISAEDLLRYELGQGHVQDIFPHLTRCQPAVARIPQEDEHT